MINLADFGLSIFTVADLHIKEKTFNFKTFEQIVRNNDDSFQ